jgi:hypothetical protein
VDRIVLRALIVVGALFIGVRAATSQGFTQASLGSVMTAVGPSAGLYLDASRAVLRWTSVVGEIQLFQSNATELVALGGLRQQLFRSSRGDIYAQALFGVATGYSRQCDLCRPRTSEFGLGANVVLNEKWAVRVRGDIRVGGSAADLLYPTLGAGITRTW